MENETAQPKANPSLPIEESIVFALPRPLPAALFCVGLALFLGFLADCAALLPLQMANMVWQINSLERLFNEASISMLSFTFMLSGVWLGNAASGTKNKFLGWTCGGLSLAIGAFLLFAVPLYLKNINFVYHLKSDEILNQRKIDKPTPGSDLAERYDESLKELSSTVYKNVFRFGTNGVVMGGALVLLGIFGIRQTRDRPEVGFTCATCGSSKVRLSQMNATEQSLATFTRLHTFRCEDCGWRFRKFSITGKPFSLFF
jgi:DNA-directed RNA polymerase subunit M/transcription elongation factor TFIIS